MVMIPRIADFDVDERAVSAVIAASYPGASMGRGGTWAISDANDAVAGFIPEPEGRVQFLMFPATMPAQTALRLAVLAADALLAARPELATVTLYGHTSDLVRARAWRLLTGAGSTITVQASGEQLLKHQSFGAALARYRARVV